MANALADETSPYLLQHKDNPVDWLAWSDDTLARAKAEDKPILLSLGHAACHWCHVMAHESFEQPEIANLMNAHFVNIKVDREERPDIDAIYQSALSALGEQGGCPLTMFLTHDGDPFWGGTYFPPESRWGRPGFDQELQRMAEVFKSERANVVRNTDALLAAIRRGDSAPTGGAALSADLTNSMAAQLVENVDSAHGGLAGPPKFPMPPLFQFFWRAYLRTGEARFKEAVTLTLNRMCQGGIYDHVGGGFARYSVDDRWLALHFEKMLYDNAHLIELMATVWPETQSPLYEIRVRETVDWCLREMRNEGGAFAAAFASETGHNFFPLTTFLNGFDFLDRAVQIAILRERESEDTRALLRAAESASLPTKVVQVVAPGVALPRGHPAAGMSMVAGQATAYVCIGRACSLPVTAAGALIAALSTP